MFGDQPFHFVGRASNVILGLADLAKRLAFGLQERFDALV